MASDLALTVLNDIVKDYDRSNFDKNEYRLSEYGGVELIRKQSDDPTGIVDADLEEKYNRDFRNSMKIPVIDYQGVTIGSARSCAMPTGGLNSKMVSITSSTYAFGFPMVPSQHEENYISYKTTFDKQLLAYSRKMLETLDTETIALLDTNKNQHFPAELLGYWSTESNTFQVPQAEKEDFYNKLQSVFSEMDFGFAPDILTNPRQMADVRRLGAQGAGNSTNQAFQFGGYSWYQSNRVSNRTNIGGTEAAPSGISAESTLFSVQPGSIGWMSRVDPDARAGRSTTKGTEYSTIFNPYLGIYMGLKYQSECSDQSAVQAAGMGWATSTVIEGFEFSVDLSMVKAHNSAIATRYNPILKVEIIA